MEVATLAQTRDGLKQGISCLGMTFQGNQCRSPLCLSDDHLILAPQLPFHLIGLRGIVE